MLFNKKSKADEITLWDKIFSFSDSAIKKYLKEAIGEYYDQIDKEKDFIKRDHLYLLKTTWYVFIILIFFILAIFYLISFYLNILDKIENNGIDLFTFSSSVIISLTFVFFSIKARFINSFSIFISLIFIIIEIILLKDTIMTVDGVGHFVVSMAFISSSIFLLETSFKFIKVIYNRFVDYKNDFIVIYPKGIYYSDKDGVLSHIHTRVEFDKITNIEAKQEGFFSSFFDYGILKISTMGTMEDIVFDHCANFVEASKRLDDTRLDYISKKEKGEIGYLEIKPFESSLRDRLLEVLSI